MIDFVTYLVVAFSISFACGVICSLSFPEDCETAENFLEKEPILFVAAWMALAILALPAAAIISLLKKHE